MTLLELLLQTTRLASRRVVVERGWTERWRHPSISSNSSANYTTRMQLWCWSGAFIYFLSVYCFLRTCIDTCIDFWHLILKNVNRIVFFKIVYVCQNFKKTISDKHLIRKMISQQFQCTKISSHLFTRSLRFAIPIVSYIHHLLP